MNKPRNLVIDGGAVQAVAFVGALHRLDMLGLGNVVRYCGISSGSILCLMLVLGYTVDEIYDQSTSLDVKKMFGDSMFTIFFNLINRRGAYSTDFFKNEIGQLLSNRNCHPDTTFLQLRMLFGKELTVVSTIGGTGKSILYDTINTPHTPVRDAIIMSAAIPWVFVSAELNNVVHFDGNLSMSCPVHMYDDYIGRTIGIRFGKAKISEDVHTLKGMTVSLLKQLSNAVYVQNNDPRIINIYIRDIPVKNEFECMEQCRSLVNRGWMCVDRYLSANP